MATFFWSATIRGLVTTWILIFTFPLLTRFLLITTLLIRWTTSCTLVLCTTFGYIATFCIRMWLNWKQLNPLKKVFDFTLDTTCKQIFFIFGSWILPMILKLQLHRTSDEN